MVSKIRWSQRYYGQRGKMVTKMIWVKGNMVTKRKQCHEDNTDYRIRVVTGSTATMGSSSHLSQSFGLFALVGLSASKPPGCCP